MTLFCAIIITEPITSAINVSNDFLICRYSYVFIVVIFHLLFLFHTI